MTQIQETTISSLIVKRFARDFTDCLALDVAVVGAGPSGITAARLLAREGFKVAVFERNLHVGGGMWGGGMLFPRIVIQKEACSLLEEVGVSLEAAGDGLYVADAVETVSRCTAAAIEAGVRVWVGIGVEDVVIREDEQVCGVVVNWGAVERAGLHVDPLAITARMVLDATGHPAEVCRGIVDKIPGARLDCPGGCVTGERPMHAAAGEGALVENTKEVYPGLVACGMAANAVYGSPRMGAIFGGMFLSAQRAAQLISARLNSVGEENSSGERG